MNSVIPAKAGIYSVLDKYAVLMEDIDRKCGEVYHRAPEIPCKNKCFDCCKQLFPISFAEAFYISEGFRKLGRAHRRKRLCVAEKINKKIRAEGAWQFEKRGVDKKTALNTHGEFAKFLHSVESDCPALDPLKDNACTVYQWRNHDCRSMGFSFDKSDNAIVGCFRFDSLKYLAPKLFDFSYRYPEKMALDRELIAEITGGVFTPNVFYFTTMCGPLIRNYAETNWVKFFEEKGVPTKSKPEEYWVVIDV